MTRFRGMSITRRMTLGFGALLVLLAALLTSIYVWHRDSVAAQQQFTEFSRPLSVAANNLERGILHVGIALRALVLNPDDVRRARFEREVDLVRRQLDAMDRMPSTPEDTALLADIGRAMDRYLGAVTRLAAWDEGNLSPGEEAQAHALRESLIGLTAQFIDRQSANTIVALEAMDVAQDRIARGLVTIGALSVVCLILLGLLITESVRRPARELVGIASALREGNWTPALELVDRDDEGKRPVAQNEMARIAHAFGYAAVALEQREQRLAADRHVARAAAASLDKEEVASIALRAVVGYVNAEVGVIYWREDGKLQPVATYGTSAAALPADEGVPGQALRDRRAVVVQDIPRDASFTVKLGYDQAPARDVAAVPILFRGEVSGVLLVASLRRLEADALEFLDDAAAQLANGLDNVRAYDNIQRLLAEVAEKNQQIQAQNEELQAQNEEIQAQSEEVQAQNEELQAQGEEIRAQNEQLAEQAERLRQHAAMLAEADQRKTEFLGLLAHELRNPMAGISNSLFVLSRADLDKEQASTAQAIIDRQTKQLNRLIDDLLDVTRVTRGKVKLKIEPLDLSELVRDCLEDHAATFERADIRLSTKLPEQVVPVRGDRARLCQIVGNLVDNAAKFTEQGRRVTVAVRMDEAQGLAELEVADEGIGIDQTAFARLFQPFSQGDPNLTRTNGGLGLGLALVKSLVEMHEGTVHAHSDGAGKGARFTVRLPLSRDAVAPSDERSDAKQSLQTEVTPCRVLIIEDNIDVAQSLSVALSMEGHEVRTVHTAQEGIELAHSFRPDVLLCDIGLPVMDGYEVARRFRADDELKSVFLVAVTGYASEKDQADAAQAGFDRHMPKPPDFQQLSELLAELTIKRAQASSADASASD